MPLALCRPRIIKSTKPKPLVTGFMMPSSDTCSLSISCGISLSGRLREFKQRIVDGVIVAHPL